MHLTEMRTAIRLCLLLHAQTSVIQSVCPGTATDLLFSLLTLQLTGIRIHMLLHPSTETKASANLDEPLCMFDLAQCIIEDCHETVLWGQKYTSTSGQVQFQDIKLQSIHTSSPIVVHGESLIWVEELEYYGFYIGMKFLHKYHYRVSGWLENSTAFL